MSGAIRKKSDKADALIKRECKWTVINANAMRSKYRKGPDVRAESTNIDIVSQRIIFKEINRSIQGVVQKTVRVLPVIDSQLHVNTSI